MNCFENVVELYIEVVSDFEMKQWCFWELERYILHMKKEILDRVVRLTEECLRRCWQHDFEFTIGLCSEDVLLIGVGDQRFLQGIPAMREDAEKAKMQIRRCSLSYSEFFVIHNDEKSCSVSGRCLLTTDIASERFGQAQCRYTFIWQLEDNEPRIKCIHISSPAGEIELVLGTRFPNELGDQTLQYLQEAIDIYNEEQMIITEENGKIYFLKKSEVDYVEADRRNVVVHLRKGTIRIAIPFLRFMEMYGEHLVQVHRSYAVRVKSIQCIQGDQIVMKSGDIIPIPHKKSKEIRERLKQAVLQSDKEHAKAKETEEIVQ